MRKLKHSLSDVAVIMERLTEICKLIWGAGILALSFAVFPPATIAIGIYFVWKNARPKISGGTAHGSARWASMNDLLNSGCLFQQTGVFLGKAVSVTPFSWWFRLRALASLPLKRSATAMEVVSTGWKTPKPLIVRVPDQMPHTAIFGASGSGKSSSFAMQILLRCAASLVCLDPKGELSRGSARRREREFGHQIIVIDPFDIAKCGYEPQSFNPLDCFRGDETRVVDEARRMANSLIVKTGKESERFWTDASSAVVTALLAFLMTEAKEGASLNHLRDITSNPQMVEQILQMMLKSDKAHGLLRRLAGELGGYEGKTKSSVYSVTNSNLSFLDSVAVGNTLSETTFDPNTLINGKATVYLVLPIDRLVEMASLQRVILSTLINLVFAAGEDPNRRVHFLLDEAATLGSMDSLYNCVQFGRSFGCRATFLFQSSSQVERCFPDSQRNDFMSTVSKVFAASDDIDTAKAVSEMMGNETILSVTEQSGLNSGHTGSTGIHDQTSSKNWGSNNSTSYAQQSRSLMTPAEVLTLPRHLAIALLPGMSPVLIEKMPYYRNESKGLLRRSLSILGDLAFILMTLLCFTAVIWGLTLGRREPAVAELLNASQGFWRQ